MKALTSKGCREREAPNTGIGRKGEKGSVQLVERGRDGEISRRFYKAVDQDSYGK